MILLGLVLTLSNTQLNSVIMTHKKPPKPDTVDIRKAKALAELRKDSIKKVPELATQFDVSKSSLYASIRGRKSRVKAAESQKHFTKEEEDCLAD